MAGSGLLIDYLGSGNIADRPVSLSLFSGSVGFWWAADTSELSLWDGLAWVEDVGGGSGDVVGPASSTDSNVALFDGATGKLLKDGGALAAVATSGDAEDVSYDNTASGLTATDVQAAIDEIAGIAGIPEAPSDGKQYARKNATWAEVTAPATTINIVTTISSGTITPAGDTDLVRPAALSAALTIANPSSTPADGAGFVVDMIDDGTTRALTWGSKYANRMATLPTTTTVSKRHRIGFEYNAADDKLYCMYAQVQA